MRVTINPTLDLETLEWLPAESYEYDGPVHKFCGPGHEETELRDQSMSLSNQLAQDYAKRFAGQDQTLDKLNNILFDVQQGKLLPGLDAATKTAMSSQAINAATANAKNVMQAVNNANAGRGGSSGLEPGFVGAERATALTGVANQEAAQQQNITLADQQARERNTAMALGGYDTLAGLQNPEAFAGASLNANNLAFNQAKDISNQYNQGEAALAGGITSLAMDAAGGIGGGLSALAASPAGASQPGAFASGFLKGL